MYSCNDTLSGGLPHSDIHGSTPARGSPWLFAACHVLHRLLVPRHPPNALIALDTHRRCAAVASCQFSETKENLEPEPPSAATPCTEAKHKSVGDCQLSVVRQLRPTSPTCLLPANMFIHSALHITPLNVCCRGLGGPYIAVQAHPVRLG